MLHASSLRLPLELTVHVFPSGKKRRHDTKVTATA